MEGTQLDRRRLRVATNDWALQCGRRLAIKRRERGFSQPQLASIVGVHYTVISKFEIGIAMPKDSTRLALACALLCEVNEIWQPLDRNYVMSVARTMAAA